MTREQELSRKTADRGFARFEAAIGSSHDSVLLVLRAHLYTEAQLDRLLLLWLPRSDRLFERSSLTYAQKLAVVDAFDRLDDRIVASLRALNRVRNDLAHELGRTLVLADATRIGSPLGSDFTVWKRHHEDDIATLLSLVISYVCGHIESLLDLAESEAAAKAPVTRFLARDGRQQAQTSAPPEEEQK